MQAQSTNLTPPDFSDGPHLLADIGGTHVRFALQTDANTIETVRVAPCADYPTIEAALADYLAQPASMAAGSGRIRRAGIAIANPVDGDAVRMTNHDWSFSIAAVRAHFGWPSLLVVNDFKALASALPYLNAQRKRQVGGGVARAGATIGLVGPGTGLGVSALVPDGERWIALDSEGGHSTFSPFDEREIAILRFAQNRHAHVSFERLVSGIGLHLIAEALADSARMAAPQWSAPQIVERGLRGDCVLCGEALDVFCAMLGTFAANTALSFGARGGLYIGGGIVPRLGAYFDRSGFRRRFEQKGRFADYLAQIPTFVITDDYPALTGMAALLAQAA